MNWGLNPFALRRQFRLDQHIRPSHRPIRVVRHVGRVRSTNPDKLTTALRYSLTPSWPLSLRADKKCPRRGELQSRERDIAKILQMEPAEHHHLAKWRKPRPGQPFVGGRFTLKLHLKRLFQMSWAHLALTGEPAQPETCLLF
jgi:hypothetical protein